MWLYIGMTGAVLVPISLFWLSFTTYPAVHWIVPILASIPCAIPVLGLALADSMLGSARG